MPVPKSIKQSFPPHAWINTLILLGYGYITVLAPNMRTIDTNVTKFFILSAFNLCVFLYLVWLYRKDINGALFRPFFQAYAGLAYALLLIVSLLSFFQAVNVNESVVQFSKLFTTFTAAWMVAALISRDLKQLKYLAIGMTVLLVYDAITVFSDIHSYIRGVLESILKIKSVYANKNILAAALFVKLPFALWLLTFERKGLRTFGQVSLLLGVTAVLFMSARAFYLGLIVLSAAYGIFLVVRHRQTGERIYLTSLGRFAAILVLAFGIFSGVQHFFYPRMTSGIEQGFTSRLSTITAEDGGGGRLKFWKLSSELIADHPITGVGLGNWKVVILEKENPLIPDFKVFYKVHNDFIETTAETGVIGGLLYLSLYVLIIMLLVNTVRKKSRNISLAFIPGFGILAYGFDAFFNFPHDRPEMQALFAIYLGAGIAVSAQKPGLVIRNKAASRISEKIGRIKHMNVILPVMAAILVAGSCLVNYQIFKSSRVQRMLRDEQRQGKKLYSSDFLMKEFPAIPNLGYLGSPVNNMIALKLIEEKEYAGVVSLLSASNPSPYDTRRELYLSLAYYGLNNTDSSLYYIRKAYRMKPLNFEFVRHYATVLAARGSEADAISLMDTFLLKNPAEPEAWKYAAALKNKTGQTISAANLMDTAQLYFPSDTAMARLRDFYLIQARMPDYALAVKYYNEGDYRAAIRYFALCETGYEAAGGYEKFPDFLNSWARSHLNLGENARAKEIFLRVAREAPKNYYALMNLGNIYFSEKNYAQAEYYFSACLEANVPDYFLAYSNLGTIYLIQGKEDLAISRYEESLQYGSSSTVIGNLYLLWKSKGNPEKMAYYEGLLKGN